MTKKILSVFLIAALLIPQGAYAAEGVVKEESKTPTNAEAQVAVKDYSNMPLSEVKQVFHMGFRDIDRAIRTQNDINEIGNIVLFLFKAAGVLIVSAGVLGAGACGIGASVDAIKKKYNAPTTKNLKEVLAAAEKFENKFIDIFGDWVHSEADADILTTRKLVRKMRAVERAKIAEEKAFARTGVYSAEAAERTKKAIAAAEKTIEKLNKVSFRPEGYLTRVHRKFLSTCSAHLKGKGGAVGAVLVAVSAIGVLTMSSVESQASMVSNKRLVVENILEDSYQNRPELFGYEVFLLKEKFGEQLVSSVLYEKRTRYMPLLEEHLELIKLPVVQELAKELMDKQIEYELSVDLNDLEGLNKFGTLKEKTQIPLMN